MKQLAFFQEDIPARVKVLSERKGDRDDRWLWPQMFRLTKELRPDWVVGENVAGHITMGLDTVLSDLESENYQARVFVLPAVSVGAPHQRYRTFVVAHSGRQSKSQTDQAFNSFGNERNTRVILPGGLGHQFPILLANTSIPSCWSG